MSKKISQKIVGYKVATEEQAQEVSAKEPESNIIQMHEKVSRPEALAGSTYKIKTPMSDHALYLTINDIILNEGTDHELRRPFEVFINSKNMDHFQWIVALTRVISAVFRKGGDCTFLVEELKAVFDPQGGYFKPGGKFMPSSGRRDRLGNRRSPAENWHAEEARNPSAPAERLWTRSAPSLNMRAAASAETGETADFPPTAEVCKKCSVKAVILMDGCMTCLNCGDSKCG